MAEGLLVFTGIYIIMVKVLRLIRDFEERYSR